MNRPLLSEADLSSSELDDYVEAFEEDHRAVGPQAVFEYLPSDTHPDFAVVAAELVRVDLERRMTRGEKPRVDDYRTVVPLLFANPNALSDAAFEEYRLRCRAGEQPALEEYASRYGIDPSSWPSAQSVAASEQGLFGEHALPREGDEFGGFELVEELGRGAFGVAFLARQTDLSSREVVLKITPRRSVEPQRLAKLHHTNITPIYSTHLTGGLLGICMPFLGRSTLATRSDHQRSAAEVSTRAAGRDETLRNAAQVRPGSTDKSASGKSDQLARRSEAAALDIAEQIAAGLAHAHERGIVHSDIKPANVLLGDDGIPRLLDFNLSGDSTRYDLQTMVVGGTLPYLAPEHLESLLSGEPVRPSSDVYSLGVLLYQLATGSLPFTSRVNEDELDRLIQERRAFSAESLRGIPGVSETLKAILAKALAPNPSNRYSAAELAEDIRRHRENQPLRFAREPLGWHRVAKWHRRHARSLRWAAAMAIGIAAVAGIALASARGKQLEEVAAAQAFETFRDAVFDARVHLHTPGREPELWEVGAKSAALALSQFDSPNADRLPLLTPAEQQFVLDQSTQLQKLLDEYSTRSHRSAGQRSPLALEPFDQSSDPISAAAAMVSRGNYDAAIALLDDVDSEFASDPVRWLLLGNSYAADGRSWESIAAYTALIALQPSAAAGYYYRGLANLDAGNYSLAVDDFTDAHERSLTTACYLLNRAVARRHIGDFRAAEQDVSQALAMDESNARAWLLRAALRYQIGNAEAAQADIRRGLALEPTDDLGYSAQGMALLRQSPEKAVDRLKEGLERYPDSYSLLKNLVHVLADRIDSGDESLPYAERLVETRPNDVGAKLTVAVLKARRGDRAGALEYLPDREIDKLEPLEALQIACVYALTSNVEASDVANSIRWLQVCLVKEPRLCYRVKRDTDLDPIRESPEYRQMLAACTHLTTPGGAKPSSDRQATAAVATSEQTDSEE